MKKIMAFLSLIGLSLRGRSQTFAEWFEQKKTQLSYLHAQIAALQSYDESIEDGNDIHEAVLAAIAADKLSDFDLHREYFESFTEVNTKLSGDPKVMDILKMSKKIVAITDSLAAVHPVPPALSRVLEALCRGLISECTIAGHQLESLLTDGAWHLNDAQRIEALDALHANVRRVYNVALSSAMELPTLAKMQ